MKQLMIVLGCMLFLQMPSQAQDTALRRLAEQPVLPRVTIQLPNGRAAAVPKGPFQPSWESIKANYITPLWFLDGKFGIFIHYGVYTVAAHASEWYARHMYSNAGVSRHLFDALNFLIS